MNQPQSRNRKVMIIAGALLVTAAGAWLSRSSTPDVRNIDSRGTSIIAFGDSLTAGYGAAGGDDYPSELSDMIGSPIINAGRSGDTTESAMTRLEEHVLSKTPRVVIVGLGGNDYLRSVPIDTTEANLRAIVREVQNAGAMVVLLGFNFPGFRGDYEAMYERVAEEEHCLLVSDVLDGILSDPALRSDAIHPNAAGYRVMAERLSKPLARLLEAADEAK